MIGAVIMDFPLSASSLLVLALIFLLLMYLRSGSGRGKLPPGPSGYPILGNLPQIDPKRGIHLKLEEWRVKYGNMFTLMFGPRPVLILCGYDLIHEAYVTYGDKFMDRPKLFIPELMFKGKGIIFQQFSPLWKEIRRLALMTMRDLGVGKTSLEEKIVDEVNVIQSEILKFEGKPFEIRGLIQYAMANVICNVCFGTRYEYTDKRFLRLLSLVNEFFGNNPAANPVNFFPWLRFIPGLGKKLLRPVEIIRATRELVEEEIENHRKTFDPENVRDFIDVYLKAELENTMEKGMDGQLFQVIHDMFNAGAETAATSLSWALLYMIRHPDAQQRCFEEIESVVGQGRVCSVKDKPRLPYTEACVLETMRKGSVAPLGIAHATRQDVEFHGYRIPKETMVIPSLWSVHYDPKLWPDPDEWRPERWLDENNKVIRHDPFMPFSTGYRVCVGQQLAQMEMFIILTSLLQHLKFTSVPGQPMPPDQGIAGIARRPVEFKLCAVRR